jgi:Domain of unknown function (DUF4397)
MKVKIFPLSSIGDLFGKCFLALSSCLLVMIGFSPLFTIKAAYADNSAYLRIVHSSPFVGTADVFVDGQPLLTSFEFASITDYVSLPPGPHKVQISLVGKGINAAALTQNLTVEEGKVYTVAALGTSADHLSLQAFEDDNRLDPSQARVRIYQLSPDAGSLDVSVGGASSVTGMKYPTASEYVHTDAKPVTFTLMNSKYSLPPLTATVSTQVITSVFIVGEFNGTPKAQWVYKQSQATPGMPNTGNDPSPIAYSVEPIFTLSCLLISCALVLSLITLRKWRRGDLKRIRTV